MCANTNVFRALTHCKRRNIQLLLSTNQQITNMAYYLYPIWHETDKELHSIHTPCRTGLFHGSLAGYTTPDLVRDSTHRPGAISPGHRRPPFFPGFLLELAFLPGKHVAESYFHLRSFAEQVDQLGYLARRRGKFRTSQSVNDRCRFNDQPEYSIHRG